MQSVQDTRCNVDYVKSFIEFDGQDLFDPLSNRKCFIEYYPGPSDVTIEFVNHVADPVLGRILNPSCPKENKCHPDAACRVDIFSNELCYCNNGYIGDGVGPNGCTALNDCATVYNDCKGNTNCIDLEDGFDCECIIGYKSDNPHVNDCINIDECNENKPISDYFDTACPRVSDCSDSIGSYHCECHTGYRAEVINVHVPGNIYKSTYNCTNIDECYEGRNNCSQICIDTPGSYDCQCRSGYVRKEEGTICAEIEVLLVANDEEMANLTPEELAGQADKQAEQTEAAMVAMAEEMDEIIASFDATAVEQMNEEEAEAAADNIASAALESIMGFSKVSNSDNPENNPEIDPMTAKLAASNQMLVGQKSEEAKQKTIEKLDKTLELVSQLAKKSGKPIRNGDDLAVDSLKLSLDEPAIIEQPRVRNLSGWIIHHDYGWIIIS